jgi:hypothetical protein
MKHSRFAVFGLLILGTCLADSSSKCARPALDTQPMRQLELAVGTLSGEMDEAPPPKAHELPCELVESCVIPSPPVAPAAHARRPAPEAAPLPATSEEPEGAFEHPKPLPVARHLLRKKPGRAQTPQVAAPPSPDAAPPPHLSSLSKGVLGLGFAGVGVAAIGMSASEYEPTTATWVFSGVFFGVGVGALVAGGILAITEEDDPVQVAVGPGALQVRGSF